MHLKSLSLINYKNFNSADLSFNENINCFLGDNGAGKTNLLDAIYYLSFCKSYFNAIDQQNITYNEGFFVIQGAYHRNEMDENIYCGYKPGSKKQFKRNQKNYKKLSEHIGFVPLVIVTPSDNTLITGGSDERRKYIDSVISQYDKEYLHHLIRYNKVLLQRNTLLKQFAEQNLFEETTLSVFDEQLVRYGKLIYAKRKQFLEELIPVFQYYYNFVSGGNEKVDLIYSSLLNDNDFENLIIEGRQKDRFSQNTSVGIHKDDLVFSLNDYPIKKAGSQGQQKTYLVSLKLAHYEFLKKTGELKPILLLDDVFDKLDRKRVGQIVKLVNQDSFGQIFLTDTNREHLDEIMKNINVDHQVFMIENGTIAS